MIRYIAVFTFLLIVGVCSYVVLNPGSYSTPVLLLASFVLCVANPSSRGSDRGKALI